MPRGKDKRLADEARHGINKKEARSQNEMAIGILE